MPRGLPSVPKRLLCEVLREGKFVGHVIASADLKQLPFRSKVGYSVRVVATCGGSKPNLNNLIRRARLRSVGLVG